MTLPATMRALILKEDGYATKGEPDYGLTDFSGYLEAADIPLPVPKPGQVLIRVRASMVNPSDMAYIQGHYGQPRARGLPAGFEGVGEVVGGQGLMAWRLKGKRVSFVVPRGASGAWAEYAIAQAASVIKLPSTIRDEDAAALIVNPLTAAAMVDIVPANGAVIVSGGASQLGKLMAGLAHDTNRRLIALVRRDDPMAHLRELGATHVLNETSPTFSEDLAATLRAEKPTVFLDCVAGAVSAQVFDAMGKDSRWIIYGKLDPTPPEILEPGKLIFLRKQIEGFWLVTWMAKTGLMAKLRTIRQVQARFADGRWKTEIAAEVSLRNAMENLPNALTETDGKVMITCQETP